MLSSRLMLEMIQEMQVSECPTPPVQANSRALQVPTLVSDRIRKLTIILRHRKVDYELYNRALERPPSALTSSCHQG
jgi:hypothetical protein